MLQGTEEALRSLQLHLSLHEQMSMRLGNQAPAQWHDLLCSSQAVEAMAAVGLFEAQVLVEGGSFAVLCVPGHLLWMIGADDCSLHTLPSSLAQSDECFVKPVWPRSPLNLKEQPKPSSQ